MKHSPNIHNTISVDQPELAIKDENYPSVKNEDHIYFDIPLLSSVKEEVTLHHDDSDHIFPIDKNINNTVYKSTKYTEENCKVQTENYVINNLETNSCSIKEEPEDLDNSVQPYGAVLRKEDDKLKLKIEYSDKTIIIEKETIGDTVFSSEIVIEKNEIQSILNKEKYNAGCYSNLADSSRTIYKDLVNCNNATDQNKNKSEKYIYTCDLCHESYISKQLLIIHMRYHFPDNDYCTNNNSKRVDSKNIKCEQLKKHKTKRIFVCTICCKQFNDQSNFRRHKMNHDQSNTKKFECKFCKKLFTTVYNLRVHTRLHTDEFPYKCDICHLLFHRNNQMLAHRRIIHNSVDQMAYDCKVCHKQFLYTNSLLRHAKIHHMENIYSCHYCQRPYTRKDSFITHLRSKHTNEKPYTCHTCKKGFFENTVLVRHMKIHK